MERWNLRGLVWGTLILWIGVMMVVDERPGVASIGAGVILLLGAVARRALGWRAGLVMTIAAVLLLGIGINNLDGTKNDIPLLAVILIAFGALAIGKAISRGRRRQTTPTITITVPPRRP